MFPLFFVESVSMWKMQNRVGHLNIEIYWHVLYLLDINNYLLKANNRNSRKRFEICSELTIKTPERHQWCRPGFFIFNFEHVSHLFSSVSIVVFEQVNVCWMRCITLQVYGRNPWPRNRIITSIKNLSADALHRKTTMKPLYTHKKIKMIMIIKKLEL